jgi:hypothetical protein
LINKLTFDNSDLLLNVLSKRLYYDLFSLFFPHFQFFTMREIFSITFFRLQCPTRYEACWCSAPLQRWENPLFASVRKFLICLRVKNKISLCWIFFLSMQIVNFLTRWEEPNRLLCPVRQLSGGDKNEWMWIPFTSDGDFPINVGKK